VGWWRRPPSTWAGRKEIAIRPAPGGAPASLAKRARGANGALPDYLAGRECLGLLAREANGAYAASQEPLASLARGANVGYQVGEASEEFAGLKVNAGYGVSRELRGRLERVELGGREVRKANVVRKESKGYKASKVHQGSREFLGHRGDSSARPGLRRVS
jgi:hypothetical protein